MLPSRYASTAVLATIAFQALGIVIVTLSTVSIHERKQLQIVMPSTVAQTHHGLYVGGAGGYMQIQIVKIGSFVIVSD